MKNNHKYIFREQVRSDFQLMWEATSTFPVPPLQSLIIKTEVMGNQGGTDEVGGKWCIN